MKKRKLSLFFILGIIVAALGMLDATYLLIIKISNNPGLCIQGVGECWSVNTSPYSEIYGIPVSFLGILGYASYFLVLFIYTFAEHLKTLSLYVLFAISLIGFLFGLYLLYIQIIVIKGFCPFCLLSETLMTVLFVSTSIQLGNSFKSI